MVIPTDESECIIRRTETVHEESFLVGRTINNDCDAEEVRSTQVCKAALSHGTDDKYDMEELEDYSVHPRETLVE